MQPLRRDVEKALRRRGLHQVITAAWVVAQANRVGKGRFRATAFRDHELICSAGSLPATELILRSQDFLSAINKSLGREIVKKIRFKAANSQQ